MCINKPNYPGYGSPCNGCGECCKSKPCPISEKYFLWEYDTEEANYKCVASKFKAGRYWCDAIHNPKRYSIKLSKFTKQERISCIWVNGVCKAKENK